MFKITRTKKDIRILCEILVKQSPFVRSCELHGNPKLGYEMYQGEMVNPSWVWPARVELTNNEVHFGCFVFDENTNTASFGNENFYRWKERKENFCYFDNVKQVAFYPGNEPKTEIFYDDCCVKEFSLSSDDVANIFETYVNSTYSDAEVKNVFFKIKQENPYYIAEVIINGKSVYYEMPVGLTYHSNLLNAANLIKEISSTALSNPSLYFNPKIGKSYLLSEEAIPQNKLWIGSRLMAVEFNVTDFKLIAFSNAKFDCFELYDNV